MKQKIYVEIAGIRLGIVTEDGAEYTEKIANEVDEKIRGMISSQKNCSLVEAAIFCAMDCYATNDLNGKKVKNLEAQIALYQANINRLRRENEELRSKLMR